MRKIQIFGLALFAVFAFAALSASSAFAESEFLIDGAKPAGQLVWSEGELLLENVTNGAAVLCSGVFNIDVISGTLVEVLELWELGLVFKANTVPCTGQSICLNGSAVTISNTPWDIGLELMAAGAEEFLAHFLTAAEAGAPYGEPTYTVNCVTLLGLVEEKCTGLSSGVIENMAAESDVLFIFNANSELATCNGTANAGSLLGEALVFEPNGLSLAVD